MCAVAAAEPCLHRRRAVPACGWGRPNYARVAVGSAALALMATLRSRSGSFGVQFRSSVPARRAGFRLNLYEALIRVFREAVFPKPRFRGWEAFLLVRLVVRGRLSNIGKPELAILLNVVNRALRDVGP